MLLRVAIFIGGVVGYCVLGATMAAAEMIVLPPPERFNHPYDGIVHEYALPIRQSKEMCRKRGLDSEACSWIDKRGVAHIVYPVGKGAPVNNPAAYYVHERAHINGWSAAHED